MSREYITVGKGYRIDGYYPNEGCRRCAAEVSPRKLNDKKWCVTCDLLDRVANLELESRKLQDRLDFLVGASKLELRK